jgi:hypothetical protein
VPAEISGATGPVTAIARRYAATGIDNIHQHYIDYFYWSAPVIVLLVIVLGAVEALPPRPSARRRSRSPPSR